MRTIARRLGVLAFIAASTLTAACGDDDPNDPVPASSVTGTYTLRSVDGDALPVTVYEDATYKLEVISGTWTINANSTYAESTVLRETDGGNVVTDTESYTGTWTRSGNRFTFTDSEGDVVTGDIQGDGALVIAFSDGGIDLSARYTK